MVLTYVVSLITQAKLCKTLLEILQDQSIISSENLGLMVFKKFLLFYGFLIPFRK